MDISIHRLICSFCGCEKTRGSTVLFAPVIDLGERWPLAAGVVRHFGATHVVSWTKDTGSQDTKCACWPEDLEDDKRNHHFLMVGSIVAVIVWGAFMGLVGISVSGEISKSSNLLAEMEHFVMGGRTIHGETHVFGTI